jgi:hypothetical protein
MASRDDMNFMQWRSKVGAEKACFPRFIKLFYFERRLQQKNSLLCLLVMNLSPLAHSQGSLKIRKLPKQTM